MQLYPNYFLKCTSILSDISLIISLLLKVNFYLICRNTLFRSWKVTQFWKKSYWVSNFMDTSWCISWHGTYLCRICPECHILRYRIFKLRVALEGIKNYLRWLGISSNASTAQNLTSHLLVRSRNSRHFSGYMDMIRPKLRLRPTSAIFLNFGFGSNSAKILKFADVSAEVYVSFL